MNRRDLLRLLGLGAAAVAAPAILVPERRIWQVSRTAPVGSRIERAYARVDYGCAGWAYEVRASFEEPTPEQVEQFRTYVERRGWLGLGRIELDGDRVVSWESGGVVLSQADPTKRPRIVGGGA